ncbi:MAG: hemolysin family protein [Planctomycetota bacterium]
MTPSLAIGLFWWITLLAMLLAIARRSFSVTPAGLFHRHYSRRELPKGFDEGEKLHRIEVALSLLSLLVRVSWVGMLLAYRQQVGAWYYVTEMTAGQGLDGWRLGAAIVELLILGGIFLELIPQVAAAWRGQRIALACLSFLEHLETVVSPLTRGFRWLHRGLLRFVGNGEEPSEADLAAQRIRSAVEIGEREGVLQAGEKSMIESVLQFHDAEVTEVMTPRTAMVCFDASSTIDEVIPQAIACGHSRIPVYTKDVDDIIGVLYVKDLLRYIGDPQQRRVPLQRIVRKIYFVPESKKIRELLGEFRTERFHIAVVLDEYGGTSGLITIEDIIEEIIGEIEDEYDPATAAMARRVSEDTFDLDGRAAIDDINRAFQLRIPESDDYETVAGFLFCTLGRVPKEGEQLEHEHLRFRVTTADDRKIKRVRVRALQPLKQDLDG